MKLAAQVGLFLLLLLPMTYPGMGNAVSAEPVTLPAIIVPSDWQPPPDEYTVINQYDPDIVWRYGLGVKGCGLVAATSALADLGYPRANLGVCLPAFKAAAGPAYSEVYGIQPNAYCGAVTAVVESGQLGAVGQVACVDVSNPQRGLLLINRALKAGKGVIVDFLATSDRHRGGTYVYGGVVQPEQPEPPFAHFARVLGFVNDGEDIVLAETMHPEAYGNEVMVEIPVEDFIAAWLDAENRARYRPADREEIRYWMMVISPAVGSGD